MRNRLIILAIILLCNIQQANSQPYKDTKLSPDERTKDLLSQMTLEEKVGQLLCPLGWEMYEKNGQNVTHSQKFEQLVKSQHIGMLWAVYRADPWTKKTLDNGLTPELAAKAGNALQKYAIENSRLGIPVFIAEEAPHGHMAVGATVFPTGIGQAATWNTALMEKMGATIAKEIRLQGGHISYGPVLDLSRDPRWSRVEEAYGEDPVLTGKIGAAVVKGTGAGNISNKYSTIATLKHFAAYGVPESGQNGNAATIGNRDLLENFLPPFKDAIDAGALSVMTSYNSIDGVPSTANKYLLTDVLRRDWGFNGFTISDLGSIEGLRGSHQVAETIEDAALLALYAGLDADLGGNAFRSLVNAVKEGRVLESVIDRAAYRVLKLKFEMGLFENPYTDPNTAKKEVRTTAHISLARQVARESVVLLKNNGILPLDKNNKVAIIGPNANNVYNQLGDYTAPQKTSDIKTVYDGIVSVLGAANVEYVKGCAIKDTVNINIEQAVQAAENADITVVVVGGSSARDFKTEYKETGAAIVSETVSDMESGEGFDRATLGLMGKQLDLLKALKATGKPVIVVYIQGRPLNMNWAAENADALLTAWYPGEQGGMAVADVLFGDYNPAGRLPISVPRSEGQLPVYYNKKKPVGHNYVDMPLAPLYSFGYGLSYTQFEYSNLRIEKERYSNDFDIHLYVKNTGIYDGDEVVQLYIKDDYSSVVQPVKQLKHFAREYIKSGETVLISFRLTENDLSLINQNMERVTEPGTFTVMIGSSSDNILLEQKIEVAPIVY